MKRMISIILTVVMMGVMTMTAFACEVPDRNQKGSISADMKYQGKAVPGGSLTIYRVGEVYSENGDYFFIYANEFAECTKPLTDLSSATLREELVGIVKEKKLAGLAENAVDKNGHVCFENLDIGLYLVVQNTVASGYYAINPFLVTIPNEKAGDYVYEVNATPKLELKPATKPTVPKTPSGKLPQTGQLNWPVPILAALGLMFIVLGGRCCIPRKKKKYEA